jgi:hypothetical protein
MISTPSTIGQVLLENQPATAAIAWGLSGSATPRQASAFAR